MTDDRVVLRVFCNRAHGAHVIGSVFATPAGHVIRLSEAVQTPQGRTGTAMTLMVDDMGARAAYCSGCGDEFYVSDVMVRDAIAERKKAVTGTPVSTMK